MPKESQRATKYVSLDKVTLQGSRGLKGVTRHNQFNILFFELFDCEDQHPRLRVWE